MHAFAPGELAIGVDECSWGSLAGPLFVGAAVASYATIENMPEITDSKKYSVKGIFAAESIVREYCDVTVVQAEARMLAIDGMMPQKEKIARAAVAILRHRVRPRYPHALVDGNSTWGIRYSTAVVDGDSIHRIIGAASIVAKADQIRYMYGLHAEYPEYGFDSHKGYGSQQHMLALEKHGAIKGIHRARTVHAALLKRGCQFRWRNE